MRLAGVGEDYRARAADLLPVCNYCTAEGQAVIADHAVERNRVCGQNQELIRSPIDHRRLIGSVAGDCHRGNIGLEGVLDRFVRKVIRALEAATSQERE